jgi:hypothetical protein
MAQSTLQHHSFGQNYFFENFTYLVYDAFRSLVHIYKAHELKSFYPKKLQMFVKFFIVYNRIGKLNILVKITEI